MSFLRPGLFTSVDMSSKGKTEDSVSASRMGRESLVALFGCKSLPSSIMVRERVKNLSLLDEHASGSYVKTENKHQCSALSRAFRRSGGGVSKGALSVFPQNIGRTMLLFYTEPGMVVIDPFAGHNSRMQLVVVEGRSYEGYDICHKFMESNKERAAKLRQLFPGVSIKLHEQDSRSLSKTETASGDFTITSPPYYDVEFYGDEPEQLGKSKSYGKFLDGMELVLRENLRVLKPGAFACWFINDFRRKGKMYFYHIDILQRGVAAGFVAHDIAIVDFGPGLRDSFLNQAVEQKILPKRHEYCVIFRKPS